MENQSGEAPQPRQDARSPDRGKVLIVDDSSALRSQVRRALKEALFRGELLEAHDGLAGFVLAVAERPDVIVCDLVMPRFDGLKLLAMCATHPDLCSVPVIMLTADRDVDRKVDLLEKGASDYVTKPFHDKELVARVRVHLRLKLMQDELRELSQRFETLSHTDPLTGLYNRRHLDAVLASEVLRSLRYRNPLGVIMVDVDHFKEVNDVHGHAIGDLVIKNLGQVIKGNVRGIDVVARYGGEEIVVVLPETDLKGSATLAERLRAACASTTHAFEGGSLTKTVSIGVACYDTFPEQLTASELLTRADQALYSAKNGGRNRVVTWQPTSTTAGPEPG